MLKAALRRKLRGHVARGGLVAYATASCYGLGCDPANVRAVARLLHVKRRSKRKGLILIADCFARLAPHVKTLADSDRQRLLAQWPGPHTWLLPASRKTSRWVRGAHAKVAVRVDGHGDARELCRVVGRATVSTSLNRAGRRPIRSYREARRQFGDSVLVLPGKIGDDKTASTIQDFESGQIFR